MAQQIHTCLKRIFTVFNVFFAIIGGIIIVLTLLSQVLTNYDGSEDMEGRMSSLILLYVVGCVTMIIAILGAYGAHKESKVSLIVFLVCMVIGSLMMLRAGIVTASARPQVESVLEERFRRLLPLDKAREDVKSVADSLQTNLHCCGLFSYQDWEDDIPNSCICNQMEEMEGKCQTIGYSERLFGQRQRKSVYTKTCFPIIMHYVFMILDIVIAVAFTLASLALIGMILSSIMIHQLRHPDRPSFVLTVPTIFTAAPPKYQELHNPPPPY